MSRYESIADIAARLAREAREASQTSKVASTAELHPLAEQLKEAAAKLRTSSDSSAISLDLIQKVAAAQIGTGAQSPSSGASLGASLPKPTLPSLQTTNLGVTAGAGGAPPTLKTASELRNLAGEFRRRELVRSAHLLKAATALEHLTRATA